MERGDTGLGRDAYGPPRRERDRRGYGPGPYPPDESYPPDEDDAAGPGRRPEAEVDDYGQLLRRPGEMPPRHPQARQPGRPQPGQPGRFPPGAPPSGLPDNGAPPGSGPNAGGPSGGVNGAAGPSRYRLPNGRRVPPGADRMYRPPGPSTPGGTSGRHHGPAPTVKDHYADSWSRPGTTPPGSHGPGGPGPGGAGPGGAGLRGPAAGPAHGAPPLREHLPAGPRFETPDGRDRPGPPPEPPGPVIRQRDTALPEDQPGGRAEPVASIAPDDLEAFARDLRALRAQADLDYPEMAETSHFEMKTLAAAAGGLRLPTLPVAVAFVRACGGNVAEWEERWQKIADRLTAEAIRKRRGEAEETAEPMEPAETPAALEPPKPPSSPPPEPDGGEVYVITSAPPRQPGW